MWCEVCSESLPGFIRITVAWKNFMLATCFCEYEYGVGLLLLFCADVEWDAVFTLEYGQFGI